MNSNNESSNPTTNPTYSIQNDEINLVEIYLTIKRNRSLFLIVVLLSLFIATFITYYNKSNMIKETILIPNTVTEHILWIEIGKIYGVNGGRGLIDNPKNILAKIESIYIPNITSELMKFGEIELNDFSITALHPKDTEIIVLKVIQTSDTVNYPKILLELANLVIEDHNSDIRLSSKNSIKPTKIIQKPTKIVDKNKKKLSNKNNFYLITALSIILSIFFGFVAVFIREFLKKVNAIEKAL